ncbi:MAG: hypothetical protein HC810_00645 [Acaryochloridaceae cyanobacterium RL_2_7]|nr:hypothetical protein [Acaryochloridaceae cyanobacterium RL_2_7]
MNPKLNQYLYLGEEQYLQSSELKEYQSYLSQLEEKVKVYEIVRDKEIFLFKILATELQERYPEERTSLLSESLSQWSLVLKTCCTAMLLDNEKYLEARVENWLKERIKNREVPQIDETLYETLIDILPEILTDIELSFLQPYLKQLQTSMGFGSENQELLAVS